MWVCLGLRVNVRHSSEGIIKLSCNVWDGTLKFRCDFVSIITFIVLIEGAICVVIEM